jgi:hypothetical protein
MSDGTVDAKVMTVVGAIKQSLQTSMGPGSSVNAHPNPFFLNINGAMDLKHAAEMVIAHLEAFEVAAKARAEKLVKEVANAIANDTSGPA